VIELEVVRLLRGQPAEEGSGRSKASTQDRPAMPRMIDGVARRFTIAVLLISLGAALYWWGKDSTQVWPVVTAVLIVACPCALALSMPFAYGHTIRLMGKQGALPARCRSGGAHGACGYRGVRQDRNPHGTGGA
jgi:hypothetical protein